MKRINSLQILIFLVFHIPIQAWGFAHYTRVIGYNAGAMGRGGTSIAISNEPSNGNFNPALISELKSNALDINLLLIFPDFDFTYTGTGNERYTATNKDRMSIGPGITYAHKNKDSPWSWGLTFSAPDAICTDYTIQSKHFDSVNAYSEIIHLRFGPIAAYQLTPKLSVGAKFVVDYCSADFRAPLGPVFMDLGQADGYGVSGGLGLLYKPGEDLSLGLYYESSTLLQDLETRSADAYLKLYDPGSAATTTYSNMVVNVNDMQFPQNFGIGVAYKPFSSLRLSADVRYFNWKKDWEELEVEYSGSGAEDMAADGIPTSIKLPVNIDNQITLGFGAEYSLSEVSALSVGYCYGDDATGANYLFPLTPATMEHTVTAGLSFLPAEHLRVGISFLYGIFNDPKASSLHGYDRSLEKQMGLPPGSINSELSDSEVDYTVYNVQTSVTIFW
jgi:long-chain fatty acid transport protein